MTSPPGAVRKLNALWLCQDACLLPSGIVARLAHQLHITGFKHGRLHALLRACRRPWCNHGRLVQSRLCKYIEG